VLEPVLKENVTGALVINMLKSCFFKPEDAKVIPKVASKFPISQLLMCRLEMETLGLFMDFW